MLSMSEKLINKNIIGTYTKRLENMNKYKFTEKGDALYITTLVAETRQLQDLHVITDIGDLSFDCDAPEDLGGSGTIATAMKLFLASFANCLEITGLLYFSFSHLKINSLNVSVEATHDKRAALNIKGAPLPGFYKYKITWYVDSEERLSKIQQVLKKVEQACPVRGSLEHPKEFLEEIVIIKENR